MAYTTIDDSILTDIADAIRTKNGGNQTYKPSEMPAAIMQPASGNNDVYKSILDGSIRTFIDKEITVVGYHALNDCKSLTKVDLYKVTYIDGCAFENCTSLTALILRANSVCYCVRDYYNKSPNILAQTPIDARRWDELGQGYIYVPRDLVSQYESSWVPKKFYFRAIEDYPEITGG